MFMQNFIKLSAAVHDLSRWQRKKQLKTLHCRAVDSVGSSNTYHKTFFNWLTW